MTPEMAEWFAGKDLSMDWTSNNFAAWAALLGSRRSEPLDVLEIGSWEGRSAIFFLRFFPASRLTCIDTFQGSVEHVEIPRFAAQLPHIEARFDANLAEFGARVRKLKAGSDKALAQMAAEGARFDLAYIDGNHAADQVLKDAEATWPLVRAGGLIIFDDYEWTMPEAEHARPKSGIDAFLVAHAGEFTERERGYQVIIERG